DAESAAVVAAVLHLYEHPRQAALKTFEQMRCHLRNRHDVGDSNFLACRDTKTAIERRARIAPGLAAHFLVIADDAIDLNHPSEHFRLGLRRAASDDNAQAWPLALQPPDRLPRLRHCFIGDRAAIDDDGVGKPGILGLASDHLGFKRVEAASQGDDVETNRQATLANSAGSNRPSYSKSAVPVIST